MDLSFDLFIDLLFRRTFCGYAAIAAFVFIALAVVYRGKPLGVLFIFLVWVIAFSIADVYGYTFVVLTDNMRQTAIETIPQMERAYQVSLHAYRIIQWALQIALCLAAGFAAGWRTWLASMIFWWGGGCDLVYYLLLWQPLPAQWEWMTWTPVGIFVYPMPLWLVLVQAGLGVTGAALLLWAQMKKINRFVTVNRPLPSPSAKGPR